MIEATEINWGQLCPVPMTHQCWGSIAKESQMIVEPRRIMDNEYDDDEH